MSRFEPVTAARRVLGALLMFSTALLAAPFVAADDAPGPARSRAALESFDLRFEALRNGQRLGEARISLRPVEGATWEFTTRTRGTEGLAALAGIEITEQSEFTWRDGRPELLQYRYRQQMAFRQRERSLARDGSDAIDSRDGDRQHRLPFEPGVMDRHVVVLALVAEVARGAAGELRFRVADRDDVEWHRYRVGTSETVTLPAGRFDAIRVERLRDNPGRTTTIWLAPALGHLPVRIVQREADGETLETRLLADD
jgi:hypothetical protein